MGIMSELEALNAAKYARIWLSSNRHSVCSTSVIEFSMFIIVLSQYLYGTYYKCGRRVNNKYYIDKEALKCNVPVYGLLMYDVVSARNYLCHSAGSVHADTALRYLLKHRNELHELLTYLGL